MAPDVVNMYAPDFVSAPGETLEELLEDRGMTQLQLAERMGRPLPARRARAGPWTRRDVLPRRLRDSRSGCRNRPCGHHRPAPRRSSLSACLKRGCAFPARMLRVSPRTTAVTRRTAAAFLFRRNASRAGQRPARRRFRKHPGGNSAPARRRLCPRCRPRRSRRARRHRQCAKCSSRQQLPWSRGARRSDKRHHRSARRCPWCVRQAGRCRCRPLPVQCARCRKRLPRHVNRAVNQCHTNGRRHQWCARHQGPCLHRQPRCAKCRGPISDRRRPPIAIVEEIPGTMNAGAKGACSSPTAPPRERDRGLQSFLCPRPR